MKTTEELLQQLDNYLKSTPKEVLKARWAKIKELNLQGPTVEEFLSLNTHNCQFSLHGFEDVGKIKIKQKPKKHSDFRLECFFLN